VDDLKRVNLKSFKEMIESLSAKELDHIHQLQHEQALDEHRRFKKHYEREECYLCGKPFKTLSKSTPCIHWLLRRCKFKAKDFSKVYQAFDYHQISSYLRWTANEERFQGNINDLVDEKDERKIIQTTIKWKNIEWTFDCSKTDFKGHGGSNSSSPHYHFQMRIDGKQFINFNRHHIPFSEKDLFTLNLVHQSPDLVKQTFGPGGSGMQDAIELDPEFILQNTAVTENEDEASYHMQTIVMAENEPIKGEELQVLIEESRATGKPIASLLSKHFGDSAKVNTIISPVDSIPDIAKRTERKRR
jgi:hypothetical protein